MKKIKVVLWLLVIAFVALVVYQNQDYFLAKESLRIDLYVLQPYQTPALATGIFILTFFVIGFLIAYVMTLAERFKARKAVRNMNATMESQMDQISALKSEVENLKHSEPAAAQESPEESEPLQGA
ncbi:MAG: hypothetical protein K9L59_11335 [Desulfobacterales bacterium]|nr:hypothetical protein [Desulfobacterales bacterium]